MKQIPKNTFFDINQLPRTEGLVLFPISMSRIANSQNGKVYLKYMKFLTKKITKGVAGVTFFYSDNLYEKYNQLKDVSVNRSTDLVLSHKNQFVKELRNKTTWAENAFDFVAWMQLVLSSESFIHLLVRVKDFYKKDKQFQKYVKEDIKASKRNLTENNINFILEETLMHYLITKEQVKIPNAYVNGRDRWRIICYPGKPNKSAIYFFQKDILNRKSSNPYQNHQYDIEGKKLYDFLNIDLGTFEK